jgi:hypothetical protein
MKTWDEILAQKVIRWLMDKYMPTYHISRNPVREKKVYREVKMEDVKDMQIEMLKARGEHDAI